MDMKLFALLVGYVQGAVSKVSNAVKSVNGKTGEVHLTATDVGAATTARGLPTGGTAGKVLVKNGPNNYDAGWDEESYVSGDTIELNDYSIIGFTNTAGTNIAVPYHLPKKLPSSLNVSHNLVCGLVRCQGAQKTTGTVTITITKVDNYTLAISLTWPTAIDKIFPALALLSGTITFT